MIGNAVQQPPVGEASPNGIDAVSGPQIFAHVDIRGGIADFAPYLIALLNHAFTREGAGAAARRFRALACLYRVTNAAGGNRFSLAHARRAGFRSPAVERKRVWLGLSVSVRVVLGGRSGLTK